MIFCMFSKQIHKNYWFIKISDNVMQPKDVRVK